MADLANFPFGGSPNLPTRKFPLETLEVFGVKSSFENQREMHLCSTEIIVYPENLGFFWCRTEI